MNESAAPQPSYRLIPSRFPPVPLFDSVATAGDLAAVMELVGWTNDRLVRERMLRLPKADWAYGRANSSVVMAAFLHAAPDGGRFNGPDLGAWYAGGAIATAIAEVGHHLRREAVARGVSGMTRTYRCYSARLTGRYRDIRGTAPALHDPRSHRAGQAFGEALRAEGADGIVYDSVRHAGGTCTCAYRPRQIENVVQAAHYEISVEAAVNRIDARTLTATV